MQGGLILTPPTFKDYSRERVFGASPDDIVIAPLNREISKVPVVYQGTENTCVSCSFTWVKQYQEASGVDLSHEFLAEVSNTNKQGATMRQVGEAARKIGIVDENTWNSRVVSPVADSLNQYALAHKIDNFFLLEDISPQGIYHALQDSPLIIGVSNFRGVGAHALVAFDVTADGKSLKCANWWKNDVQDVVEVPFSDIVTALSVSKLPDYVHPTAAKIPAGIVLLKKLSFHRVKAIVGLALSLFSGGAATQFGAGYTPVTDYEARTTSYISSSASTIPVNSTKDKAGNEISLTNISVSSTPYVYFSLEPGTSREEIVACGAKSVGSWSSCLRGLPFQGGSLTASSTLQFAHNAGSKIVITNVGQFFTEFVSISGNQTVYDTKTFNTLPRATSTTALPSSNAEFTTWYAAQTLVAGGFSALNIDTAYGLSAAGTAPEKVRINISPTSSGMYFPGGQLAIQTSSTGGAVVNGSGSLVVDTGDSLTWTAAQTFAAAINVGTPSAVTEATPKSYVDTGINTFTATGTAAGTISAGNLLAFSSTSSRLFVASSAASTTAWNYVGVALSSATVGTTVTYARPGGIAPGFVGLTPGSAYYLSTGGGVATTPGTIPVKIGTAYSTSSMMLQKPGFRAVVSGNSSNLCNTGASVEAQSISFVPTKISMVCASSFGSNGSSGTWWQNSNGASSTYSIGITNSSPFVTATNVSPCSFYDGSSQRIITVVTTTAGFNLVCNSTAAARPVAWTAEYDEQ